MQVTQLKYRLSEGNGECFYYLGEPSQAFVGCPDLSGARAACSSPAMHGVRELQRHMRVSMSCNSCTGAPTLGRGCCARETCADGR